jgi:hypothetical protein
VIFGYAPHNSGILLAYCDVVTPAQFPGGARRIVSAHANALNNCGDSLMKALLASVMLSAALLTFVAIQAQTPTVTATCKDGTSFTGTSRSGACRGHGGVQSWGTPTAPAAATTTPAAPATTAAPATAAPAPTKGQPTAAAAGGGAGQVWVNLNSKVYHCPGDKYYGNTKKGAYMTEADAKAKGYRPDHGKTCTS